MFRWDENDTDYREDFGSVQMIARGCCRLYRKENEGVRIWINIYKGGKIGVYWFKINKEGRAKYQKKLYARNQKILDELKINGCAICGYDKCNASLDFHHTNPKDKKFLVNNSKCGMNVTLLVEEVNKCILLCRNCHGEIHYGGNKK